MRLTLRTLLAYIDDTLPPAQAKEIGSQIGTVPEAAMLMQKLQDVIRKRRLLAPTLTGPGSGPDPNFIGEYLESSLPPAVVVEIEQLCYRSDMHLAEVGACHKILTLILGEPVEVPQDVRERMYALGTSTKPPVPAPTGLVLEEPPTPTKGSGNPDSAPTLEVDRIPSYLRPQHTGSRWFTALVIVALAAGWLALSGPELKVWWNGGQAVPGQDQLALNQELPLAAEANLEPQDLEPQGAVAPSPAPPVPVNPTATSIAPDVGAEVTDAVAAVMPAPTPGENANVMPLDPEPENPAVIPQPEPELPVVPLVPAVYVAQEDIMLSRPIADADWVVAPSPHVLPSERYFAVPQPFRVQLDVGEGTLAVEMLSGTLIERLPLQPEEQLALGVDRGRLLVRRGDGNAIPRVRIVVNEQTWLLQLTEPETVIGIEVALPAAMGLPNAAAAQSAPMSLGGLQVLAGACHVTALHLPAGINLDPTSGPLEWGATESNPTLPPLDWMVTRPATSSIAQRNARDFLKEFLPSATVSDSISPVVDSRLESMADFATQTMALTDNLPGLARALSSEHESSRLSAIDALQRWLPRDPENETALAEELSRSFSNADVKQIIRLLWGYPLSAGRDPEISQELVSLLAHEQIVIREIAFYHVVRLSNRRYDYRAMLPPNQRAAAEARWQTHLQRVGALAE